MTNLYRHLETRLCHQPGRAEWDEGRDKGRPSCLRIVQQAEKKILRNLKSYIKGEILKVVEGEGQIPISALQHLVVVEKQFCSRSTFFSHMKELKSSGLIENKTIDGQVFAMPVLDRETRNENEHEEAA